MLGQAAASDPGSDHWAAAKRSDRLRVVAEALLEDLRGVGPERMTGVERHERAAFEAERAVRNDDAAELGVVDSLQAAAGMHVLVLDHLAQFAYRRAGHALFQHELGDLVLGMLRGPALEELVDRGHVRSEEH